MQAAHPRCASLWTLCSFGSRRLTRSTADMARYATAEGVTAAMARECTPGQPFPRYTVPLSSSAAVPVRTGQSPSAAHSASSLSGDPKRSCDMTRSPVAGSLPTRMYDRAKTSDSDAESDLSSAGFSDDSDDDGGDNFDSAAHVAGAAAAAATAAGDAMRTGHDDDDEPPATGRASP
jgi:hypothetical protein